MANKRSRETFEEEHDDGELVASEDEQETAGVAETDAEAPAQSSDGASDDQMAENDNISSRETIDDDQTALDDATDEPARKKLRLDEDGSSSPVPTGNIFSRMISGIVSFLTPSKRKNQEASLMKEEAAEEEIVAAGAEDDEDLEGITSLRPTALDFSAADELVKEEKLAEEEQPAAAEGEAVDVVMEEAAPETKQEEEEPVSTSTAPEHQTERQDGAVEADEEEQDAETPSKTDLLQASFMSDGGETLASEMLKDEGAAAESTLQSEEETTGAQEQEVDITQIKLQLYENYMHGRWFCIRQEFGAAAEALIAAWRLFDNKGLFLGEDSTEQQIKNLIHFELIMTVEKIKENKDEMQHISAGNKKLVEAMCQYYAKKGTHSSKKLLSSALSGEKNTAVRALIYFLLANVEMDAPRARDLGKAMDLIDMSLKNDSNPVYLLYNLRGTVLFDRKQYRDAIADYNTAASLLKATKAYEVYSKKSAEDIEILFNRGEAHFYLGEYSSAEADIKECLKLAPEDVEAKALLDKIKKAKKGIAPTPAKSAATPRAKSKSAHKQDF